MRIALGGKSLRLAVAGQAVLLGAAAMLSGGIAVASSGNLITGKAYGPGEYRIAGHALSCRSARTVVSSQLADYGAWVPGTIVLNPRRLNRLSVSAQLFVYSHECGHQIHGRSEAAADCYAANRGRREGWLSKSDIAGICGVFPRTLATGPHAARGARCAVIRACFAGNAQPAQLAGSDSYEAAARSFLGQ